MIENLIKTTHNRLFNMIIDIIHIIHNNIINNRTRKTHHNNHTVINNMLLIDSRNSYTYISYNNRTLDCILLPILINNTTKINGFIFN